MNENYARKFAKVFEGLVHQCSHLPPAPFIPFHAPVGQDEELPTQHLPQSTCPLPVDMVQSPVCLTQPHLESDGSSDADAHLGPA